MIFGQFSPSIFLKLFSIQLVITIILIYILSQMLHHQTKRVIWISDCAAHFPQFVFFRIATISGAALLALGWMVNHFYLKSICREKAFNLERYRPQIAMIFGMMGAMLLMGSTANLDTGKRDDDWHVHCASSFFVFTFFGIHYNTILGWIVHLNIKSINLMNLYGKTIISILMIIQLLMTTYIKSQAMTIQYSGQIQVILEWTGTFTLAAYIYLMSKDIQAFKLVYQNTSITTSPNNQRIEVNY